MENRSVIIGIIIFLVILVLVLGTITFFSFRDVSKMSPFTKSIFSNIPVFRMAIKESEYFKTQQESLEKNKTETEKRMQELDKKIKELEEKQQEFDDREQEIEMKQKAMEDLKTELDLKEHQLTLMGKNKVIKDIKELSEYYELMDVRKAAEILQTMDDDFIIQLLLNMRKDVVSRILSNMDVKRAATLTKKMGG